MEAFLWASTRPRCLASSSGATCLPVGRLVVLEELAPDVGAGVEAIDDRVDYARGAVDDVERRVEPVLCSLRLREMRGILVGDPAGVNTVHVDSGCNVIGCRVRVIMLSAAFA